VDGRTKSGHDERACYVIGVPPPCPTRAEIEAGRRLFAGDWHFLWAAGSLASLPPMRGIEIAFAGRSNVGKSSLINALTGRRGLARISHTPGRTQELIFFAGPSPLTLVDMPGYGYAAAAKSKVKAWTELIHDFLKGRANLARVYLLIDARHGFKTADAGVLGLLDQAAVNYQIVLTKADEVSGADAADLIAATEREVARHPAAHPGTLLTSAHTDAGIPELRAAIARLVAERARR
jgi:GTP-binding protein